MSKETKELQSKTVEELQTILREDREKLQKLQFSVHQGQHKNVRDLRSHRRHIGRLLTLIQQKSTK